MVQVVHARWIAPVVPQNVVLNHHSIVLGEDGNILDILPHKEAKAKYPNPTKEIHLEDDHILIPGLINVHCHTAMSLLRGFAPDVRLQDWLMHYMWPAEGKWVSEDFVRVGSSLSVAELIQNGVTCVNDMYFFPHTTAEVFKKAGLRASIGIPILPFPTAWASNVDEYFSKGLEVWKKYENDPLIQIIFAPHAPYTVDDATFEKIRDLVKKNSSRIHIHVHETQKEVDDAVSSSGERPIHRLHRLGVLTDRTIAVHMTHLNDEDIKLVVQSGMIPFSIESLAWQVLEMATLNGAKALGLAEKVGSLEIGKAGDIIAVRLVTRPVYNPLSSLVYVGTNRVEYVWVQGKALLEDSKLITMDETMLRKDASAWEDKIVQWDINRKNAPLKEWEELWKQWDELAKDKQNKEKEVKEVLQTLSQHKDELFHLSFFAAREEIRTPSVEQLNAALKTVESLIEKLGTSQ